MTGFDSKRQMARDKRDDDDDTQVYADTLLIVYQRGFADGKRAAQRPWQGLTEEDYKSMSAGDKLVSMFTERTIKERNT
jgi:hypothetical protein